MKFTDGYWVVKPEMEMHYAAEAYAAKLSPKKLEVLAPCRRINGRGDTLDGGALTVSFTTPLDGVIRVEIVHHKGAVERGPFFAVNGEDVDSHSTETDSAYEFTSGPLTARVSREKGVWQVDYIGDGRVITSSCFHGMAHALNRETGRVYSMDSLMLDVGECVYGLGERFTALCQKWPDRRYVAGRRRHRPANMAYKNVPFYMTNRGYGIFVDRPQRRDRLRSPARKSSAYSSPCEGETHRHTS